MEAVARTPDLPLLLSGGVDSGTILAALLEMGRKPDCYLYRLEGRPSPDAEVALRMCEDFNLSRYLTVLSEEPEEVDQYVREVIRILRTARKASIQCALPIFHMTRVAAGDGHRGAFVGTGAVVLDDRTVMVRLAAEGEEAAREYRAAKLNDRYVDCGTGRMHEIARKVGVPLEEPYSDEPLRSYALSLDIEELNTGPGGKKMQKGIAVRAFPDFWGRPGYYRRNSPLQVASGLRELHDEVFIQDPTRNPWGYRAVAAVYRKMMEEEIGAQQQLTV